MNSGFVRDPFHGIYFIENYAQVTSYDLESHEKEILPPMHVGRHNFASIMFEGCIYVFGGWDEEYNALSSCER